MKTRTVVRFVAAFAAFVKLISVFWDLEQEEGNHERSGVNFRLQSDDGNRFKSVCSRIALQYNQQFPNLWQEMSAYSYVIDMVYDYVWYWLQMSRLVNATPV